MRTQKFDKWLRRLSYVCLLAVVTAAATILIGGERWWFSAAATYLPRAPWLIPSGVLMIAALWRRQWRAALASSLAVVVVAWPLMNLRLGVAASLDRGHTLRVATCNIQNGKPAFGRVLRELVDFAPDVVAFQECAAERPDFADAFPDFQVLHEASFLIGSRWPVVSLGLVESDSTHRWCGCLFRVDHPERPFAVLNVHCSTARHGLLSLRDRDNSITQAIEKVNVHQALREGEVYDLQERVDAIGGLPVVLMGDFNQPPDGTFLQRYFGDWTNAFDAAGVGYGYTAPCDTSRLWPPNTPWLRIDHVLVRPDQFAVTAASAGRTNGSDHRTLMSVLTWSDE